MNWWEDQRTWSLNTFWRRWHFVMCENCFPICFFEVGDLKVQLSWSLKGVNLEMTLIRRCEVLIINCPLCWKNQVKPTHTDRYLDYNSNHPTSAKLSVIHTLTHRAKQVCSTPELLAKEMDHLHKVLQDNHYPPQFCQQGKLKQKTNKKPNPSMEKFIEEARVVIPYIKGLSEQYRHTLAKYRVRVFFKGTSTIKSLLMHPKDPILDAHKTDIIYHWKCPANNCTAEYIGETNRSLKERVSDHRNQTTSAIRNHHDLHKTSKSRT